MVVNIAYEVTEFIVSCLIAAVLPAHFACLTSHAPKEDSAPIGGVIIVSCPDEKLLQMNGRLVWIGLEIVYCSTRTFYVLFRCAGTDSYSTDYDFIDDDWQPAAYYAKPSANFRMNTEGQLTRYTSGIVVMRGLPGRCSRERFILSNSNAGYLAAIHSLKRNEVT